MIDLRRENVLAPVGPLGVAFHNAAGNSVANSAPDTLEAQWSGFRLLPEQAFDGVVSTEVAYVFSAVAAFIVRR